jgi:hypothetical protein
MRKLILLLSVLAAPLSAGYTYYFNYDFTTFPPSGITVNGSYTFGGPGMGGPASLIGTGRMPSDGTSDYEVRTEAPGVSCGDHYLRASPDAYYDGYTATGSFYVVRHCGSTVWIYKRVGGVLTLLTQASTEPVGATTVRSVIRGDLLRVFINDRYVTGVIDSSLPTGAPGFGTSASGISSIQALRFGALDRVAPPAVNASSIRTYVTPNRLELSMPA